MWGRVVVWVGGAILTCSGWSKVLMGWSRVDVGEGGEEGGVEWLYWWGTMVIG